MINYELVHALCTAKGISGDETAVRSLILNEIKDYADWRVDALGNILVHKKGKSPAKARLMLSAHMDEVGLMVTDITADGFLKFDEVGGIDRRVLPGKAVTVGKNHIPGVIGVKPIHLCKGEEAQSIPAYSEMYIDIGADSQEQATEVVGYGDSVCYDAPFLQNEYSLNAKAIDDRFGCYVMIELIKSDLEYDADFAFVVQQEVKGLKDGKYTVAVSTQGGGGQSKYELFIIGDNGEKKTAPITDNGWNKWQTVEIKDVIVKNGKATIGVEMQANAGNWGSMDNFEFYLQQ